jgi:hypothetical protein
VWCITEIAILGPVFLEGGLSAKQYLQLLNQVFKLHIDKMQLTVRQFYHQEGAAPLRFTGEVQKWLKFSW